MSNQEIHLLFLIRPKLFLSGTWLLLGQQVLIVHHTIVHVAMMPFVQILKPTHHHLVVPLDFGMVFNAGAEVGLDQSVLLDVVQVDCEVYRLEELDTGMV